MMLVLKKMLHPSLEYLTSILLRCKKERKCLYTLKVHAYMRICGLETHNVLGNYLILLLVEVGSVHNAQQVFERLESRDELSWNSLITGHIKYGETNQAFMLYEEMQEDGGLHPNGHTFVALLKACTKLKDLERGEKIHAEAAESGLLARDPFVSSTLLDMYLKCGSLVKAKKLFDENLVEDVISWTALITAYVKHGHCEEALHSFENMQRQGVSPDAVTFICSLKACGSLGSIEKGCIIHADIEKNGLIQRDVVVGTALVDMYAKCGLLAKAKQIFDNLPIRSVVSWNALISGYVKHGFGALALTYFEEMQMKGVSPDAVTFICALKACGSIGDIDKGQKLHEEVERQGLLEGDLVVGNAVMDMYAKCGWLAKAQRVFDILPARSTVSWNALISGYAEHGFCDEALDCFRMMEYEGTSPDAVTFACSLKACSSAADIFEGQEIHAEIARMGFLNKDPVIGNSLVDLYAKCGCLAKAQEVFDKLPVQNVVSWNALISGYMEHRCDKEALNCYERMGSEGVIPDPVTLVCCLKACGSVGDTDKGSKIHDEIVRKGLLKNHVDVGNTLVDMYTKFGWHAKAHQVFDLLPVRDIVSWNAILAGYSKHGHGEDALKCFEQMQLEGVPADAVTLVASLKACASIRASKKGQELHAKIQEGVFEKDVIVGTALVHVYAKCGLLDNARQVFDNLPIRDTVSWNALISGYADRGNGEDALKYYEQMQLAGVSPNAVTLVCSLKACGIVGATDKGLEIHAEISRKNLLERELVGNTLVDMYAKCGLLGRAQEVFDKLPARDVVSWTALVAGFAEHGRAEDALNGFEKMQREGVFPNALTFVFSLKACGSMGATDKGQEIHSELERLGILESDLVVSNALVDMYAKSGSLAVAQQVFDNLPARGVACFNSLIAGYAHLGESASAFLMLDRMVAEGLNPDAVTYIIVLNACCQSSLFDKGHTHFEAMSKNYGIVPSLEHHTCLVDLFGRAGELDKAVALIEKLPICPDRVVWLSMLGSCGKWGNMELGRQAFERAVCLDAKHAAAYVLFSNVYASIDLQKGT